jgi:hypothetical protein
MKIFLSHSKRDESFCDRFDRASGREPIAVFRSEYEVFDLPVWKTIYDNMKQSIAMFLLVGKELVEAQNKICEDPELLKNWKYTQNWISYEVGLACDLGIDVWVICDNLDINFPIPYLNNYDLGGLNNQNDIFWLRDLIKAYLRGETFPYGFKDSIKFTCPSQTCGAEFNLYSQYEDDEIIICPTCLKSIPYKNGKMAALSKEYAKILKSRQ